MTRTRAWQAVILQALSASACGGPDGEDSATVAEEIAGGYLATPHHEAVIVNGSCSGSVIAPRVVMTAGHCGTPTHTYHVVAPNAGGQTANATSDWTTYTGDQRASLDLRLLFLDTPIHLASYPTLAKHAVLTGTKVRDIGRTLNGKVTSELWASPTVTIEGSAAAMGFPHHYRAQRDLSQGGDSGGPIEIVGTREIIAIVDTDTVEHHIAGPKIDLFVRVDLLHDEIERRIAAHGGMSP